MADVDHPTAEAGALEDAGPAVLRELRFACAAVLGRVGGAESATTLCNRLSIDRSLAWKIWRIAHGDDIPAPKHIPGAAGMERFLRAAEVAGAPPEHIESVRRAHGRFAGMAREQAGDRASADILFGSFTREGRRRLEAQLRRDAYRANSHFLGIGVHALYQLNLVIPGVGTAMPDVVIVRGHYRIVRMRPGAGCVLSRSALVQPGGVTDRYRRLPLDPDAGEAGVGSGVPLVKGFCSEQVPPVSRRILPGGVVEDELGPGPIGALGAADVVTAERATDIPWQQDPRDAVTMQVRTPVEFLCFDVLLHEDSLSEDPEVELKAFSLMHGDIPFSAAHDRDQLPELEPLERLGRADALPPPPGVERHQELLAWVCGKARVRPERLLAFRVRMKRPPIPICLAVSYTLHR